MFNLETFKSLYKYEMENKCRVSVESAELLLLVEFLEKHAFLPEKEWNALEYWLDRCYEKGHLDNCSDLIEPLEDLYKARGFV